MGCVGMRIDDFCRCTPFEFHAIAKAWHETDAAVNPKGVDTSAAVNHQGLDGNPGTTGEVFTDECTYVKMADPKIVSKGILETEENAFFKTNNINGSDIILHPWHDKREIKGNMIIAKLFCEQNKGVESVKLLPNVTKENEDLRPSFYPEGKFPRGKNSNADALITWKNGDVWNTDFKLMQGNGGKLKDRLDEAYLQADYAVIKIEGNIKDVMNVQKIATKFIKKHNQFKGIIIYNNKDEVIFNSLP